MVASLMTSANAWRTHRLSLARLFRNIQFDAVLLALKRISCVASKKERHYYCRRLWCEKRAVRRFARSNKNNSSFPIDSSLPSLERTENNRAYQQTYLLPD
jgi:hypothetical protein